MNKGYSPGQLKIHKYPPWGLEHRGDFRAACSRWRPQDFRPPFFTAAVYTASWVRGILYLAEVASTWRCGFVCEACFSGRFGWEKQFVPKKYRMPSLPNWAENAFGATFFLHDLFDLFIPQKNPKDSSYRSNSWGFFTAVTSGQLQPATCLEVLSWPVSLKFEVVQ